MVRIDKPFIKSLIYPTNTGLCEFYKGMGKELLLRGAKVEKFEDSDDSDEKEIFLSGSLVTALITTYIIVPLQNLYPAVCVLRNGHKGHTLNSPLDNNFLKQYARYGKEYDFSSLAGEIPMNLIAEIRQILVDIQPACVEIVAHYANNPPRIKEAANRTAELIKDKGDELKKLVEYCGAISCAADIQPVVAKPPK